ncbi:uncharacterized protein LDX57_012023 [Aspergillus melleus]|uniref:uncharacterized protein n=1 Tax=Aspergillus melleus TaxID=138277 RepID=UPI001E8EA679|nr:uncharacterized protein LDX57_012023 [Aspergillus melleus]KAH8434375.1 hypothetical protein LDX57_012023 [Aspergillus melleus]
MADRRSSPDYKALYLEAIARTQEINTRTQEINTRTQEINARTQKINARTQKIKDRTLEDEAQLSHTIFVGLLRHCCSLSRSLKVEIPSRSTAGQIPTPTGKYCPTRLEYWTDCSRQLSEINSSVSRYFHSEDGEALRLFPSMSELTGIGQRLVRDPLSSERQLEAYERFAVEDHVQDVITELCKLPAARIEFGLGDGIQFKSHANILQENEEATEGGYSRPDQFCIHRVDGITTSPLTSIQYKPPHKLAAAALRMSLRPRDLWKDMVRSTEIPTDQEARLKRNAERLACSAIVQEYHVMIQEGLEYSYVTNGITRVLLRVPRDKPSTLYYFCCDLNSEVDLDRESISELSKTSIAQVTCLYLMAFRSSLRDQEWRNRVRQDIPIWQTSFEHIRSQISKEELQQILHFDDTDPGFPGPESGPLYEPSPPPPPLSPSDGNQVYQVSCVPSDVRQRSRSPESSGSDTNREIGQKRRESQVIPSPSAQFCTQGCLHGLQSRGGLDDLCPNVANHRRGHDNLTQHLISSQDLLNKLKAQLDENVDRCIPYGRCGSYGAPFKLTCMEYGYTVIGKGTTSGLWNEVSREAQVYRILRKAQGSAVPIFLGLIDLAKVYFLHGAGEIRHMLVMGWGGECTGTMELTQELRRAIRKSDKEIQALRIVHGDLRRDNVLWNEELGRALIIDFHRCTLKSKPTLQRPRATKRPQCRADTEDSKRLRP